jgi:uncharacterized protein (TIGR03437 family)
MMRPLLLLCLASGCGLQAAVRLASVQQFGGSDAETVAAMVRDAAGNLYLTGRTNSFDFPASTSQLLPGGSSLWRVAAPAASPLFGHLASQVYSIAADPAHPGLVFLWTNRGLLRSADYGNTFTGDAAGLPAPSGGTIAIDPRDTRNLYLAHPADGIFRSNDGGATWSQAGTVATNRRGMSPDLILVDPWNPGVLLAILTYNPSVYRSLDSGATWQLLPTALGSIAFDPTHQGVAYGLYGRQVFRSSDSGATWSKLAAPEDNYYYLAVDSNGSVYASASETGGGVIVSRDGGATWTRRALEGFITALAADPASSTVYAATHLRILASTDGFATTTPIAGPKAAFSLALLPAAAPSTPSTLLASVPATSDAYVLKLDPAGNRVWASYLGGTGDEAGSAIAVDADGNVYVAGTSSSDFPNTNFVSKLSTDGRLLYSKTFAEIATITAISVDTAGSAYLAGTIIEYSFGGFFSFPNPYAAACKLDSGGSQLIYCSKLGSGRGLSIAVDSDGGAFVGGDGVWRVSPGGSVIYYRGLKATVSALAFDSNHSLYVAGNTVSPDFLTTPGAFQRVFNAYHRLPIAGLMRAYSDDHAFVLRMNPDTGDTLASTLLQGENWEHALALSPGPDGTVTVGGATASNSFPLLGGFQTRFGYYSGFVSRLSGDLSTLLFSTYVGDNRNFPVSGLALASDGSVLFAGDTANTSNAVSGGTTAPSPSSDIFVAALQVVPPASPLVLGVLNSASQVGTKISPNQTITVVAPGAAADSQVLLDGDALPVVARTPDRIVARIPLDYPVTAARNVQVRSGGQLSDPLLVAAASAAPAIYTVDGSGRGQALVFLEDGSLVTPENPAAPGSPIAIACNGIGRVTFDGNYAVAATDVSVYVDGFYANGVDAHMLQLPGIPGDTYVIRVYVPDPQIAGFKMPSLVSLTLNVGGTSTISGILSQPEVAISIKQ